jgi:hypothetical protein
VLTLDGAAAIVRTAVSRSRAVTAGPEGQMGVREGSSSSSVAAGGRTSSTRVWWSGLTP